MKFVCPDGEDIITVDKDGYELVRETSDIEIIQTELDAITILPPKMKSRNIE